MPTNSSSDRTFSPLMWITCGLLAVVVFWFAGRVLLIALAGVLVAVMLNAVSGWLSEVLRLRYGLSLTIVVLAIVLFFSGFFLLLGSRLSAQSNEFTESVTSGAQEVEQYLSRYRWGQWVMERVPQSQALGSLPGQLTNWATSALGFLSMMVIILFLGLYLAVEPRPYRQGLLMLVPPGRRERADEVVRVVGYNLRWWLFGQLISMTCVGILVGLGLWLVGAKLALALGVLASLFAIVPNIGPVLWLIPASLVAMTQGPWQVLNVFGVFVLAEGVESYALVPLIQRQTVQMPPALSILAIVLLGSLGGVLGALVATPLALVVMLLVKMLYVEDMLGNRDLDVPGEDEAQNRNDD